MVGHETPVKFDVAPCWSGWVQVDPSNTEIPPDDDTQKLALTQEMPETPPQSPAPLDHPEPLYSKASPSPSTAAQKVVPTQDSPCRPLADTITGDDHAVPFHCTTLVLPGGTAMQKLGDVHDTAATSPPTPIGPGSRVGEVHWLPSKR